MNKYEIKYTKDGHWTSHSFDTWKELKAILWELKGIKITLISESTPKAMRMACIEHNESVIHVDHFKRSKGNKIENLEYIKP